MIMHNGVYGSFGIDGDSEDAHTLCEGYMEGYVNGQRLTFRAAWSPTPATIIERSF